MNELRLPNGDLISSNEDVLECLFSTHFPGCVNITSSDEPDVFSCSYDFLASARSIVTVESIEWARNSFTPFSSPGADGIYPILLQKGYTEKNSYSMTELALLRNQEILCFLTQFRLKVGQSIGNGLSHFKRKLSKKTKDFSISE